MEITTPNNDPGIVDPATGRSVTNAGFERNVTRMNFEQVIYDARPQPKKPGFFSGLLRALGGFAPLAYLAAPFTGGLSLIAGAGLQSMGAIGAKSQANFQAQQAANNSNRPVTVSYPGMMSASLASDPTLSLVSSSRDASMTNAIQNF
jgi:hypothetical protein